MLLFVPAPTVYVWNNLHPCTHACVTLPKHIVYMLLSLYPWTPDIRHSDYIPAPKMYMGQSAYIPEPKGSVTLSQHPWTLRVGDTQPTSLNSWRISASQPTPLNVCSDSIDQSPNERRRQAVAVYLIHLIPCALSLSPPTPSPLGINGFHFKWGGRVKTNMISQQGGFEPCILLPWDSGGVDSNDPYRFS
jgi:hypothetical protein